MPTYQTETTFEQHLYNLVMSRWNIPFVPSPRSVKKINSRKVQIKKKIY